MSLSCWVFLILLLLVILAIAMILSSSRDEDGKVVFSITNLTASIKRLSGQEDDDNGDDMYSDATSSEEKETARVDVDSWDSDPAAFVPPQEEEVDEVAEIAEGWNEVSVYNGSHQGETVEDRRRNSVVIRSVELAIR